MVLLDGEWGWSEVHARIVQDVDIETAIVLFTRDLRLSDQPALSRAVQEARHVVPLFIFDEELFGSVYTPNRIHFLVEALSDLRLSLQGRGGDLVVRRGSTVAELDRIAKQVNAAAVYMSDDVSPLSSRRRQEVESWCSASRLTFNSVCATSVVPPFELRPGGGDHFRVFTPYWRRWKEEVEGCVPLPAPDRIALPAGVDSAAIPTPSELCKGSRSTVFPTGGESEAHRLLDHWISSGVGEYESTQNNLSHAGTSQLSPYLHFGCISPTEVVASAAGTPGGEGFIRQICWRDFFNQLLAANPQMVARDYRPRNDRWLPDDEALERWKRGLTGYPIVDAGMRQLLAEGWMHNRARLITASFLTKTLYMDWRLGARHYADHLVDADVANNIGNWQWMAGTGADTRPNRVLNPILQAHRHDPDGDYVRRYVPELAGVVGSVVHEPWKLSRSDRRAVNYPEPIVDLKEANQRFRLLRASV